MGVNSLITWAVIDPVIRAVITKTQALSFAFCREFQTLPGAGFGLSCLDTILMYGCGLRVASWLLLNSWDAGFNHRVLVLYVWL